jgi:hypothetical protein
LSGFFLNLTKHHLTLALVVLIPLQMGHRHHLEVLYLSHFVIYLARRRGHQFHLGHWHGPTNHPHHFHLLRFIHHFLLRMLRIGVAVLLILHVQEESDEIFIDFFIFLDQFFTILLFNFEPKFLDSAMDQTFIIEF